MCTAVHLHGCGGSACGVQCMSFKVHDVLVQVSTASKATKANAKKAAKAKKALEQWRVTAPEMGKVKQGRMTAAEKVKQRRLRAEKIVNKNKAKTFQQKELKGVVERPSDE